MNNTMINTIVVVVVIVVVIVVVVVVVSPTPDQCPGIIYLLSIRSQK